MFYPNVIPLFVTVLLLQQVVVQGGLLRELSRKFVGFFKWSKPRQPALLYQKCNLCLFGPCTPVVWPSDDDNFDGNDEAEKMNKLLSISGKLNFDEEMNVAKFFTDSSAQRRTALALAFKAKYDTPLFDEFARVAQTTYQYHILMQYLSLPLSQMYNKQLRYAIYFQKKGKNYQEQGQAIIVEMLTALPKHLIDEAITSYNSIPGKDFTQDLDTALKDVGKPDEYREIIKKLVEQKRDTNQHASWIKAFSEARKIKSAVISRRENEMKERFSELFTKRSIPQIIETIVVYENLRHGDKEFKSFLDDIDKEYKGGEKEVYKIMVGLFTNKSSYYAKTIEDILKRGKNNGTYEDRFVFIITARYDIDLKDIIVAYNQESKTGMKADFEGWDNTAPSKLFHQIMLHIIENASRKS